jgi:hypothetical protein
MYLLLIASLFACLLASFSIGTGMSSGGGF